MKEKKSSGGTGLPNCLIRDIDRHFLGEVIYYYCPKRELNHEAQSGMDEKFLEKLGLNDSKYINGEANLIFKVMWAF